MNEQPAKLLVAELRSGKYQQCTGSLQKQDRYCCLGVSCVAGQRQGHFVTKNKLGIVGGHMGSQISIAKWLGIAGTGRFPSKLLSLNKKRQFPICSLTELNDDLKWTFPQIADFIEENWREIT